MSTMLFAVELAFGDTVTVGPAHTHGSGSTGYLCAAVTLRMERHSGTTTHTAHVPMKPYKIEWPLRDMDNKPDHPQDIYFLEQLRPGTWRWAGVGDWWRVDAPATA